MQEAPRPVGRGAVVLAVGRVRLRTDRSGRTPGAGSSRPRDGCRRTDRYAALATLTELYVQDEGLARSLTAKLTAARADEKRHVVGLTPRNALASSRR
jgi:hypothetical protein